jgi:putative FmdB family regulatory protein
MPLYEFNCKKCNKTFDFLIFSKNDIPECPDCKGRDVEKQFSVFGFSSGGKTVTSGSGHNCSSCGTHNCGSCH